ncbi:cAMP-regulated phosphoprotein 21 isoform X3 [Homalodisca vitripennis]|nr:cAMP-regulated phosphoprotein 21 isoform X3 [Homalodisca vitripennis]
MDRHSSSIARTQWSMSNQSTFDEETEPPAVPPPTDISEPETATTPVSTTNQVFSPATNNNILPRCRSKTSLKLLKRSHAINESTSPPPDILQSPLNSPISTSVDMPTAAPTNFAITANGTNGNGAKAPVKRDGSSQSTDSNWSSSLSRGNSIEQQYMDHAGIDIEQFIVDTLNKNSKDRSFLLRIENELVMFTKDNRRSSHKFGAMSSYQRMLVHRVAHYFGMEHNVDSTGHMVIVNKGKSTRLPENKFSDFIRDEFLLSEEPRRSILKRDSASFEDTTSFKSPDRHTADPPRRSKSFEEREEEYEKARRRIFHQENEGQSEEGGSTENLRWPLLTWSTQTNTTNSDESPNKLHPNRQSRLTKVESYESKDTLRANSLRGSISKSNSFGGYDQSSTNGSAKTLTKQDSGSSVSSRVSPSSSGYKSQSQRSDATLSATPSPSATPHLTTQLSSQSNAVSPEPEPEPTVMWAVTNMASVPPGSVLINPQTGRPFTNLDGTVYHFDPENPPKFEIAVGSQSSSKPATFSSSSVSAERQDSLLSSLPATQVMNRPPPPQPPLEYHPTPQLPHTETTGEHPHPTNYHQPTQPHLMVSALPIPPLEHSYGPMYSMHQFAPAPPPPPPPPPPTNNYERQGILVMNQPSEVFTRTKVVRLIGRRFTTIPRRSVQMDIGIQRDGSHPDLCSYIMGLSFADVGRGDRHMVYCPTAPAPTQAPAPAPGHPSLQNNFTQGPTVAAAMYYPGAATNGGQQNHVGHARYTGPTYNHYLAPERPAGPEYQQFFSTPRCPSNGVGGGPACCSGNNNFYPVQLPPPPPTHYHRIATPPNTPQNGACSQFALYNGGYPTLYHHHPQLLRPTLQVGVPSSPPRTGAPIDPHQPASPLRFNGGPPTSHPAVPVFRLMNTNNDVILFNAGRPVLRPHVNGRNGLSPNLRHQSRSRGMGPGSNVRPILGANQQAQAQQQLQQALEAVGLGIPPPGQRMQ